MVQRGGGAVQGDQETLQEWRGRGAEAERGESVSPIVGWGVWVLCGRGGRARQPFGDHAQQGPPCWPPLSPHPLGLAQADPFAALRILVTLSHLPVPTPAPGAWQSSPPPILPSAWSPCPRPVPHPGASCQACARQAPRGADTHRRRVHPSDSAQPLEPPLAPLL